MVASTLLSVAGADAGVATRFSGELRQLRLAESKNLSKPRKLLSCSIREGHHLQELKCFWRLPSSRNLNLTTRSSQLRYAYGKETEDSFFSV